jgi:phosphopantothenoylcysteine decarboxylase/phosphopantothenate--cysteine ligase
MTKPAVTKVLVIVTGGIAVYKVLDVIRLLKGRGVDTKVVMTPAATAFVTPLSFETLSGNPVLVDQMVAAIPHIRLGEWADLVLVAPASADFLARAAWGLGDDLAATTLLALPPATPLVIAPAMNVNMWENPMVQANLKRLQELLVGRVTVVEPVVKELACGTRAKGALADPAEIVEATLR